MCVAVCGCVCVCVYEEKLEEISTLRLNSAGDATAERMTSSQCSVGRWVLLAIVSARATMSLSYAIALSLFGAQLNTRIR